MEALTYYFFLLHIPITLLVDLSPIYPASFLFALPGLIRNFYVSTFQDPLLAGESVPGGWFTGFLLLEGFVQLPICLFVVLQFARKRQDALITKLVVLCYSIQVLTTTWGCLFELSSFTKLGRLQLFGLIGFYAPYLVIPGFMAWDSTLHIISRYQEAHQKLRYLSDVHDLTKSKPVSLKVILITGANSGVGFGIVQQLIDQNSIQMSFGDLEVTLILTVRDQTKAESVSARLSPELLRFKGCLKLEFVLMDLTSMKSIQAAVESIREKSQGHVDVVICNAGMAQFTKIDLWKATKQSLTHPIMAISEPDYKVQSIGGFSEDGMGVTFQANFFGHYYLCGQLADTGTLKQRASIVIWMSSLEATRRALKSDDLQAISHQFAYESSKRITDVIWSVCNDESADRKVHIRQYLVHPGFCATNIIADTMVPLLTPVFNKLWTWTFYFARFCGSQFHTATAYNGAYAAATIAMKPEAYDATVKWGSAGLWDGTLCIVKTEYDEIEESQAIHVFDEIEALRNLWVSRLSGKAVSLGMSEADG